jgi:hypothetical protein
MTSSVVMRCVGGAVAVKSIKHADANFRTPLFIAPLQVYCWDVVLDSFFSSGAFSHV